MSYRKHLTLFLGFICLMVFAGNVPQGSGNRNMLRTNKLDTLRLMERFNVRTNMLGWLMMSPNIGVEMTLGNMRIILFPREAFEQMVSPKFLYPEGFNGTVELAFDVPTFADVDKEYQNAIDHGAASVLPPTTEPWGQRTCYVADPDGNLIEIGSFTK